MLKARLARFVVILTILIAGMFALRVGAVHASSMITCPPIDAIVSYRNMVACQGIGTFPYVDLASVCAGKFPVQIVNLKAHIIDVVTPYSCHSFSPHIAANISIP